MSSGTRALLVLTLAVLAVAAGVLALVRVTPGGPSRASVVAARPTAYAGQPAALEALHAWDDDRAAAWADGSPSRLADLYLPGSQAGREDVRLLQRYRSRGYVVTGMRTQVLDLVVLEHTPGWWQVRVTDRLAAATATSRGHGRSLGLPRDDASTRQLTLARGDDGRWRVGGVTDTVGPVRPAPR